MEYRMLKLLLREKELLISKLDLIEKAIEIYSRPAASILLRHSNNTYRQEDQTDESLFRDLLERYPDFDQQASVKSRVLLVLRRENRFLHVREIARIFKCLGNDASLQKNIRSISPALSVMKKNPAFGIVSLEAQDSHFNTFWGFREWLDKDGKILSGFKFSEREIFHPDSGKLSPTA